MNILKNLLTEMNCFSVESIQKMIECFNSDEHRTFWIYFFEGIDVDSSKLLFDEYDLVHKLNESGIKLLDISNLSEVIKYTSDKCNVDLYLSILNKINNNISLDKLLFSEMLSCVKKSDLICLWELISEKITCKEKTKVLSMFFEQLKNSDNKQYELFIDSYYLDRKRFFYHREWKNLNLKKLKEEIEKNKDSWPFKEKVQ